MSSSEDERQEKEERAKRDARWAKTHTRWDLVPDTVSERQRVDMRLFTCFPQGDRGQSCSILL